MTKVKIRVIDGTQFVLCPTTYSVNSLFGNGNYITSYPDHWPVLLDTELLNKLIVLHNLKYTAWKQRQ